MTTQDWILLGTLAICVGGPTTIGTAIAVRVAVRGGLALARTISTSALAGGVATTAAFIYMSAQGGGGDAPPGFPELDPAALEVETLILTFDEVDGDLVFRFGEHQFPLDRTEHLLIEAVRARQVREIHVHDNAGHTGGMILQIRNLAQTFGLQFSILEAEDIQ